MPRPRLLPINQVRTTKNLTEVRDANGKDKYI